MQEAPLRYHTLLDLASSLRRCLEASFTGSYWVSAETSDLRTAGGSGHCYLELLQKGDRGEVVARLRANIWASTYMGINQKFISAGLQPITSGMKILALVQVTYREQYGLSLVIQGVDLNYSLGEIARLRQETIARLKRNGLYAQNKELSLPLPLQRLAIISSPTAAGYEDFMRQLEDNRYGLQFYTKLFPARMQGEGTTESVIHALGLVSGVREHFDAIVIIRGGGAVSELRAFDSYELAEACAQVPLPLIVGIGHERDESVLDLIAHTSMKTPTAVAEYIVSCGMQELARLRDQIQAIATGAGLISVEHHRQIETSVHKLPAIVRFALGQESRRQGQIASLIGQASSVLLSRSGQELTRISSALPYLSRNMLEGERTALNHQALRLLSPIDGHRRRLWERLAGFEQAISLAHPDKVLKRGFAILEHQGGIVKDSSSLQSGERVTIRLYASEVIAQVESITPREG